MTETPDGPPRATWPARLAWTAFTLREIVRQRNLPRLAPERLAALQARRVRAIVAHAYATVPYYHDAMAELGLEPRDFRSADDLARLPLVTGADLAAAPERFLSTAVAGEPLLETATSGTTGHAKRIWWDRGAVFHARAAGLQQRRVLAEVLGATRGRRTLLAVRAGGTSDDVRAFHRAHAWLPDPAAGDPPRISPEDDFATAVAVVNRVRPDVVAGFGAYVAALYRWARVRGVTIHAPRVLLHGGEQLPAADAALLADGYGVAVLSTYQACEALRIALQCPRGDGLHVYADQVALRVADERGRTLPPGEHGQIVLSNLTNRATVLLNYALGDRGAMATGPCACGRTLPVLASLDGRADDLVRLPGGEIAHDSVLLSRLYAVPGVLRLQLVQEELDRFVIRVVATPGTDVAVLRARLSGALVAALAGRAVQTTVDVADALASDASGKFRTVVSHVRDAGPE